MYYALTINTDQIITGVHESVTPILTDTFAANPELADDTVVTIPAPAEYQAYTHILCYEEDGTLKDLVWCIENGYMELPQNKEIINGELVDKEIPAEEQPQTLKEYFAEQFGIVRQETAPTQKAATVMFRALAQTDVITADDALDNAAMFPLWADNIGQRADAGSYWRHGDKLYRVNAGQGHTIQADWAPDYKKGDKVTHGGKRWISTADANTWVPGAYGWEESK